MVARISGAVNTERWIKPLLTLSSVCSLELIILPFHSDTSLKRCNTVAALSPVVKQMLPSVFTHLCTLHAMPSPQKHWCHAK
ncbi:hypothetical protein R3I93_011296 [Phoxinus phoxinus]|uniref:Uncharacterized protein n=1 Tax=Phoxinus phoxinus TaxID=58324 RepID=A0AAN9CXN8_9TELE